MKRLPFWCFLSLGFYVVIQLFLISSSSLAYSGADVVQYVNDTASYFPNNSKYQTIKTAVNTITCKNWLNSNASNYNVIYIYWRENANNWYQGCRIELYTDVDNMIVNNANVPVCSGNGLARQFATNNSAGSQINLGNTNNLTYCASVTENQEDTLWGMCLTDCLVPNTFKTFVGKQAIIPPFYIDSNLEDLVVNNVNYKGIRINYLNTFVNIGKIEGVSDTTHFIRVTFSSNDNKLILEDVKELYNGTNTSQVLFIDNSYNIYVSNRLLSPNIRYALFVDAFTDSSYEVNVGSAEEYYFSLNYNAVISGDHVENFGSGEYSLLDSTNDLIMNLTDFNNITSGDFFSALDVPDVYIESGENNFFNNILLKLEQVFLQDEEVTITVHFPIDNASFTLRSDFWVTEEYLPELASFLEISWYFFISLIIIYRVDLVIDFINLGEIRSLLSELYESRRLL